MIVIQDERPTLYADCRLTMRMRQRLEIEHCGCESQAKMLPWFDCGVVEYAR